METAAKLRVSTFCWKLDKFCEILIRHANLQADLLEPNFFVTIQFHRERLRVAWLIKYNFAALEADGRIGEAANNRRCDRWRGRLHIQAQSPAHLPPHWVTDQVGGSLGFRIDSSMGSHHSSIVALSGMESQISGFSNRQLFGFASLLNCSSLWHGGVAALWVRIGMPVGSNRRTLCSNRRRLGLNHGVLGLNYSPCWVKIAAFWVPITTFEVQIVGIWVRIAALWVRIEDLWIRIGIRTHSTCTSII